MVSLYIRLLFSFPFIFSLTCCSDTDCKLCDTRLAVGQSKISLTDEECEICVCREGRTLECEILSDCTKLNCNDKDTEVQKCCEKNRCSRNLDKPTANTNVLTKNNFIYGGLVIIGITIIIVLIFYCHKHYYLKDTRSQQRRRSSVVSMSSRGSSLQ